MSKRFIISYCERAEGESDLSRKIICFSFSPLHVAAVNWAAPNFDELQEIYLDTCQSSCGIVNSNDHGQECREKFCPNYASYLLTGLTLPGAQPSFVSEHRKEAGEFCATWMLNLIEQLGWHSRIRLNMKECACAAGKDCLV